MTKPFYQDETAKKMSGKPYRTCNNCGANCEDRYCMLFYKIECVPGEWPEIKPLEPCPKPKSYTAFLKLWVKQQSQAVTLPMEMSCG